MEQYIITKQFILKGKTFLKDKLLSTETVSQNNIKRLLARKYIKSIGAASISYEEPPFFAEFEKFLAPKQVNELRKSELIEYAKHIGLEDLDTSLNMHTLRDLVNSFIAANTDEADKENDNSNEQ